jgi:hypothetical protein
MGDTGEGIMRIWPGGGWRVALLGDVNNDGKVNIIDRAIVNAVWRMGSSAGGSEKQALEDKLGSFTLKDCDLNCDGAVVSAVEVVFPVGAQILRFAQDDARVLGRRQVTAPCPLR